MRARSLSSRWPRDYVWADMCSHLARASGVRLPLFWLSPPTSAPERLPEDEDWTLVEANAGPTLGVAVVSWLLGTAGAVVTLVLLRRATTDQDGPFTKCIQKAESGGVIPAVGTV